MTFLHRCLMTAFVALALPAAALAEGIELKTEAFQDVLVKDKKGKSEKKRQPVTNAVPGGEVIYILTYRNTGKKPASGVVINDDVPASLAYVPGSAGGAGTRPEVSVDGGKTWGALDKLSVKAADGSSRAARGEDVTHVRWTVNGAVGVGREGSVTYRATVR